MGMYDTLNNEQIKFFHIPTISMPDDFNDSCLYYSGGYLRCFDRNKAVPFATFWYNYGKDFNIIDLFPYDHEGAIVHIIRGGRNRGFLNLSSLSGEIFNYPFYSDRGTLLKIDNKDDIINFYNAQLNFREALKKQDNSVSKEYFSFLRDTPVDSRNTDEFKEKFERLHNLLNEESKKNEEMLIPFRVEISKFHSLDEDINIYEDFGAIVSELFGLANKIAKAEKIQYTVSDERLIYVVAYNEMLEYYNRSETFIEDYKKALKLDENMSAEFDTMFCFVKNSYNIISKMKLEKENFFKDYALRDVLSGRYKEFYLKYNIVPYEGFNYAVWDGKEK